MPARTEVLGDGTIRGEKALGMPRRFEALHTSLALSRRLVGVLSAIIQVAVLPVFHPWQDLALGRRIALQLIRHEHPRDILAPFEQLAEERLGSFFVASALDEDVQPSAVLLHRPPQIVALLVERDEYLIQVPLVAWAGTPTPELIGILLPKFVTPLADRFIGHCDTTNKQEFFHVAVAEAESVVEPDAMADDLRREAVVLITGGRCWSVQATEYDTPCEYLTS
jgi:hypothetical protein